MPLLRPVHDHDVPDVLALNERNVVALAPMDEPRLHELRGLADRFDVIDVAGAFGGFVITFAAGEGLDGGGIGSAGRFGDSEGLKTELARGNLR